MALETLVCHNQDHNDPFDRMVIATHEKLDDYFPQDYSGEQIGEMIYGQLLLMFLWRNAMKKILLSADSNISVFAVPDKVADNLSQYCLEFCCNWLYKSPNADKYRVKMGDVIGVCYTEKDFIDYLNKYICDEQSTFIMTLANVYVGDKLPDEYAGLPYFNF